eukprot:6063586-Lingulodinium_polyedra.AAC.1
MPTLSASILGAVPCSNLEFCPQSSALRWTTSPQCRGTRITIPWQMHICGTRTPECPGCAQ